MTTWPLAAALTWSTQPASYRNSLSSHEKLLTKHFMTLNFYSYSNRYYSATICARVSYERCVFLFLHNVRSPHHTMTVSGFFFDQFSLVSSRCRAYLLFSNSLKFLRCSIEGMCCVLRFSFGCPTSVHTARMCIVYSTINENKSRRNRWRQTRNGTK